MPKKRKLILPAGSYKLCTTQYEDRFQVGQILKDGRTQQIVRVLIIVETVEYHETVWDVYVIPHTDD